MALCHPATAIHSHAVCLVRQDVDNDTSLGPASRGAIRMRILDSD